MIEEMTDESQLAEELEQLVARMRWVLPTRRTKQLLTSVVEGLDAEQKRGPHVSKPGDPEFVAASQNWRPS